MSGYWHLAALSAVIAAVSAAINQNLFIVLFLWLAYLFYDERIRIYPFLLALLTYLFFLYYFPHISNPYPESISSSPKQVITGKVVSAPEITKKKLEFIFEEENSNQKILVIYFQDKENEQSFRNLSVNYGAECSLNGSLEIPETARNPGQFDYQHYLATKNISYQIVVDDLSEISCTGTSFFNRFFTLRYHLIEQGSGKMSEYTQSWINALVLGDKSLIDENIIELFQNWGLSHLLAISGLHIGIVTALVYFMLIKLNLLTKEKTELVMLLFLPMYAILAGGEPSVLRASMMVILFIISARMKMRADALDSISIVFLLLVIYDSFIIYHVGFQFSFIVTLGIILSRKWLSSVHSSAFQVLIISFISQMIILPFQLQYFGYLQPLSILLNLLIVPYFSVFVIPYVFLLLLFSFLPRFLLRVFDELFIMIHQGVIQSIEWTDKLFHTPLLLTDLPLWFFIMYYTLLIAALILLEKKHLKRAFFCFTAVIFLLAGYAAQPYFSPKGYVTMLDIGQGDAFIIELPKRQAVFMIDAGARFSFEDMEPTNSVYKQIIKPYLYSRGIQQIDALFITHEDIDHMGSVEFMIQDRMIANIFVSEFYPRTDRVIEMAQKSGVPVYSLTGGESLHIKGQEFNILGPMKDKQSANENSLVMQTKIGERNWLFTGDMGKEEEKELLKNFELDIDVLKVAHHGSRTSTGLEFIKALQPDIALISAGKNNAYGHPAQEVVADLESEEVNILRTDVYGAVQYRFDAEKEGFYIFLSGE